MYYYAKWIHKCPNPEQPLIIWNEYETFEYFQDNNAVQHYYDKHKKRCDPNCFIDAVGEAHWVNGRLCPNEKTQQLTNLNPQRDRVF